MSRISRLPFPFVVATLCLGFLANRSASAAGSHDQLREVVVVFKTHFDIGYTDMASNVVHRYRTEMIDNALKCVEDSRGLPPEQRFVWTIPGWPMYQILQDWPGQSPDRKAKVIRALKDGRFVVHALPFTTHTELLEPEDLVRGLEYSSRVCRELGLPLPRDAKMTDVPCHSWFLPTLLKHAGVEFLHLGCNPGSRSPNVPRLFWWEGPDHSRVLTMYSAESYGTGLKPPSGWPYRTWLALIQTGDNHGPPRPEEVRALLAQASKDLPGVKVRIGRMSDFADAILAEKADVPVVRADMPDTWIHGPLCDPAGAKTARNVRPAISSAEFLQTHLQMLGLGQPGVNSDLGKAFEQSLLYGEHTWGGALGWAVKYSAKTEFPYGDQWVKERATGRFARLENSWAEHSAYIQRAEAVVRPVLDQQLSVLAAGVATSAERLVVYNPLPWQRDGLVRVKGQFGHIKAVEGAAGGDRASVYFDGETVTFLARDIPPMGHRTFVTCKPGAAAKQLRADPARALLENRYFRAVIDGQRGALRSLTDKTSGRELVDEAVEHGFGQFVYERFDASQVAAYVKAYVKIDADWAVTELGKPGLPPASAVPYHAAHPAACSVSFETNEISAAAVLRSAKTGGLPCPMTTRVILYDGQPYLDLEITLEGKPADPWPEAGWLAFPAAVTGSPRFSLMRQFSIMDPSRDVIAGANRFLFGVQGGAAITDKSHRGIAFCPLDSPLVSFDRPGCWQYAMDFTPSRPVGYINLFNNQWSTNFRLWNGGSWTSRVRVWAVNRRDGQETLAKRSLETRYPLLAGYARGVSGPAPLSAEGLQLSRGGVTVSAFGPNSKGPGTILRLWEIAGESGTATVTLPARWEVPSVLPVDLRGTPLGASIPVKNGKVRLHLDAFSPVSLAIGTGSN